jgi:hypothetical protein
MTEDFWSSWFAFALLAGPILLSLVSLAFSLYLSHRHLDAMLEALKGSHYLAFWAAGLRDDDWFRRFTLTAQIGGMVMWPGPLIRAGEVGSDQIRNFPAHLKRLLVAETVLNGIILAWGAVAFVLLKLK